MAEPEPTTLQAFLERVATDETLRVSLQATDADRAAILAAESGLSEEDQHLLLGNDRAAIAAALGVDFLGGYPEDMFWFM